MNRFTIATYPQRSPSLTGAIEYSPDEIKAANIIAAASIHHPFMFGIGLGLMINPHSLSPYGVATADDLAIGGHSIAKL